MKHRYPHIFDNEFSVGLLFYCGDGERIENRLCQNINCCNGSIEILSLPTPDNPFLLFLKFPVIDQQKKYILYRTYLVIQHFPFQLMKWIADYLIPFLILF